MTFNIKEELAPLLAVARYEIGIVPSMSTGIYGFITVGYGKLDDSGHWEYPLRYDLWPDSYKRLYDKLNTTYCVVVYHKCSGEVINRRVFKTRHDAQVYADSCNQDWKPTVVKVCEN